MVVCMVHPIKPNQYTAKFSCSRFVRVINAGDQANSCKNSNADSITKGKNAKLKLQQTISNDIAGAWVWGALALFAELLPRFISGIT